MPVTPAGFAHGTFDITHSAVSRHMAVTLGFALALKPFDVNTADLIMQNTAAALAPILDASVTVHKLTMHGGTVADPLLAESSGIKAFSGAAPFETPPVNSACLVKKVTGVGGRRNQGRMFWPGMVDENVVAESGHISSVGLEAIQNGFDDWFENLTGADIQPVVLHSEGKSSINPPTDIVAFLVDPTIGTQRRRLGR